MDILLVKPSTAGINYPHNFACLSSYLKSKGHSVSFCDASLTGASPLPTAKAIYERGYKIIGIGVYTGWHAWVRDFIKWLKMYDKRITTIVGGPHISATEEAGVDWVGADYGIKGEGEVALERLLSDPIGKPKLMKTDRVSDLDTLPLPDYKMIKPEIYFKHYLGCSVSRKSNRIVQTLTSRGCPFACSFCASEAIWRENQPFILLTG